MASVTLILQILGFKTEKHFETFKIYETSVLEFDIGLWPFISSVVLKPGMVKVVPVKRRSLKPKFTIFKYPLQETKWK